MYNNALMRFFPRPMGVPNMGTNVPNVGTNVPNVGMLNIPFEGGMPNTYKQPQIGLPFEGGMQGNNKSGFFPGPFGLSQARNALMGIGGYRGSGMNVRQEY